jgi:hypothetical protein
MSFVLFLCRKWRNLFPSCRWSTGHAGSSGMRCRCALTPQRRLSTMPRSVSDLLSINHCAPCLSPVDAGARGSLPRRQHRPQGACDADRGDGCDGFSGRCYRNGAHHKFLFPTPDVGHAYGELGGPQDRFRRGAAGRGGGAVTGHRRVRVSPRCDQEWLSGAYVWLDDFMSCCVSLARSYHVSRELRDK